MNDSKKADSVVLNALHLMVAEELAKLFKKAESNDEKLRVLREMRGFLKDNDVVADLEFNKPLKQLAESAGIEVAELPFGDDDEVDGETRTINEEGLS